MEITDIDKHNIFDLFDMCIENKDIEILKLNGLDKWFQDFRDRIELYCVPELNDAPKQEGVKE